MCITLLNYFIQMNIYYFVKFIKDFYILHNNSIDKCRMFGERRSSGWTTITLQWATQQSSQANQKVSNYNIYLESLGISVLKSKEIFHLHKHSIQSFYWEMNVRFATFTGGYVRSITLRLVYLV